MHVAEFTLHARNPAHHIHLGGEDVTPVRRLYGDDFIIDEAIWALESSDDVSRLASLAVPKE